MTSALDQLGSHIWDASPFSIVVTDYAAEPEQRKIIYVNSAFTDLTGFAAEDVVGKPVAIIDGH
jgi:PAS domain S-box-containing protein